MSTLKFSKDGSISTTIMDQEGDEIKCSFDYDNGVRIHTKKLAYVCFSIENLRTLARLINHAEAIYKARSDE